jgi:hypothetical protein
MKVEMKKRLFAWLLGMPYVLERDDVGRGCDNILFSTLPRNASRSAPTRKSAGRARQGEQKLDQYEPAAQKVANGQ